MIYIVCSNLALGHAYVRAELHGQPWDREFMYITTAEQARAVTLVLGDKVHVISTNEHPLTWALYNAWHQTEIDAGLPPRPNAPYVR